MGELQEWWTETNRGIGWLGKAVLLSTSVSVPGFVRYLADKTEAVPIYQALTTTLPLTAAAAIIAYRGNRKLSLSLGFIASRHRHRRGDGPAGNRGWRWGARRVRPHRTGRVLRWLGKSSEPSPDDGRRRPPQQPPRRSPNQQVQPSNRNACAARPRWHRWIGSAQRAGKQDRSPSSSFPPGSRREPSHVGVAVT
jgi:hypothetical protein